MRIVIAEDEALFREGLTELLTSRGHEIVDALSSADGTTASVRRHRPDCLVTDIRMPPTMTDDGFAAALRVRAEHRIQPIVVLTQHVSRAAALELTATGSGVGYLLKHRVADIDRFVDDLVHVASGGTVIDPEVGASVSYNARRRPGPLSTLTPRQLEVLALIAEGRSNAAIADRLVVTEKAVVQHASRIYDALDLPLDSNDHRRVLAVLRYLTN